MRHLGRFTFSFLALAIVLVYTAMTNRSIPEWQKLTMYAGAVALVLLAGLGAKARHQANRRD